ncbi:MAG: hypothetical protein NC087_04460 [Anaeroplasma bactoclasticum]|nr:hypothetical protein [Anaeroplasma bactoclasticum]
MYEFKDFRKEVFFNASYRINCCINEALLCCSANYVILHKKKKQPLLKVGSFDGCFS